MDGTRGQATRGRAVSGERPRLASESRTDWQDFEDSLQGTSSRFSHVDDSEEILCNASAVWISTSRIDWPANRGR